MNGGFVKLGDLFPTLTERLNMGDNKPIAKQKQDKSKLSSLKSTVKATDKKGNEKKREGVKDRR